MKKLREGPQFHPMVRTLLLSACPWTLPRLLTFSDQKILGRIPRWNWNCRFPPRGPRKSPSNFPVMLKFAKTTREKIAGRTSIPPHGSHPFIVGVSVDRAEITNIFGPKHSMQDTTLLAGATMLLSNERNYCPTSGQRVQSLRLRESSLELHWI